jgi:hypothetical protein
MTTGGVDSGILGDCIDSVNRMAVDTIFVQVAAFRDPEYLPTLHSMVGRATHPERLRVGACLQYDWDVDEHMLSMGRPPGLAIDEIAVDAASSGGVCWARSVCQGLHQDEDFTLQIDSHMRFTPGWDVKLIQMWRSLRNRKAIISHYAPNYEPGGGRCRKTLSGLGARTWKKGTLWFEYAPVYQASNPPTRPIVGAFVSGHFLFGPLGLITQVPYDPYLERHGEESSLSVRLWTNGYNLFHPNQVIMWHRAAQRRPMDYQTIENYDERVELSAKRCQVLLSGLEVDDPRITQDLEHYGLGSVRTLEQYQEWAGVDFKSQTFTSQAERGLFKHFRAKRPVKMVK